MKKIKRFLKKSYIMTLREINETKHMIRIYRNREQVYYDEAKKQAYDIVKILIIFPVLILPGSAVILTILEIIAKGFKTSIFPKKQNFK